MTKKEKYTAEKEAKPGTCRICGCTEKRPCQGGCGWVDGSETLCSSCVNDLGVDCLP